MPRYTAFLRAINVGGHTVTMAALARHFEDLGCSGIETVVASGNVVFDAASKSPAALEKRIAAHLEARLGYAVATFLRTPREIADIAARIPSIRSELGAADHAVHIGFLGAEAEVAAHKRVLALATPLDLFRVLGRELYWLRRGRFSDSKVSGAMLEKALGQPATLRNATTVLKVAARYS
jgi:uncharacterized protein (DUF1697 family)